MFDLATRAGNKALATFIGVALFACSPANDGGTDGPSNGAGAGGDTGGSATTGGTGAGAQPTAGAGGTNTGGGAGALPTGGTLNGTGGGPTGGSGTATGGTLNGTGGLGAGGTGGVAVFNAGSDPARNRVQPGQVCDRLATIQCAGEAYCCDNPGRTVDQCKAAQLVECGSLYLDQISMNVITGYNVDAAEAAFTELESLASQCDPDVAAWGLSTAGLRGITLGTVAANGVCNPANLSDQASAAASLASCQNPATHACIPTGFTGVPPVDDWVCAPRSNAGGPCFSDLNCVDGLYCDNPLDAPDLVGHFCAPRKATGTPCASPNECVSLTCKTGLCVDATTQTAYCLAQ